MHIQIELLSILLIFSASSFVVECLRNEFIGECSYYRNPNWIFDWKTFICFDHFRYFGSQITEMKCSNTRFLDDVRSNDWIGTIDFENCQMSRIKFDIFNTYYNLRLLNISSIELQYLPEESFIGAQSLEKILASNNRLIEVIPSQFINAPKLLEIDFSINKIIDIAESAFTGIEELQILNLSHNHIETLHRNTFQELMNLTILDLSFNNIRKIENTTFANLESLEFLSLAHNELLIFEAGIMPEKTNLQKLNLSNNKLLRVALKSFGELNNVELINLCYNQLKEIIFNPMGSRFPHLEIFRLNNNQFNK